MTITVTTPATAPAHSGAPESEPSAASGDRARRVRTDELLHALAASPDELGRQRIRDEIVRLNVDVAEGIAARYRNRGVPREDLEQVACLGLVKAVRGFDPAAGHAFLSYAVPTIRGEVLRHFRDAGWSVRPPRPIQELQPRIAAAREDLGHRLGRAPRPTDIAEHLGVAIDDVVEAMSADGCFAPSSLDAPLGESQMATLGDQIACDDALDLAAVDARVVLAPALRHLAPRDRRIVYLRFFEGLTQREIGEQLGVTQMQVSRLLSRILRTLREALSDDAAVPDPAKPVPPAQPAREAARAS